MNSSGEVWDSVLLGWAALRPLGIIPDVKICYKTASANFPTCLPACQDERPCIRATELIFEDAIVFTFWDVDVDGEELIWSGQIEPTENCAPCTRPAPFDGEPFEINIQTTTPPEEEILPEEVAGKCEDCEEICAKLKLLQHVEGM